MLTDDHALIDRHLRVYEHHAAVLQVEQRVGHRNPGFRGDQRTVTAARNIATIILIGMENAVQNTSASGFGQEPARIADQAARRGVEYDTRLAGTRGPHVKHRRLAPVHRIDDCAGELLVDVDRDLLDRLLPLPVLGPDQDARARHCHLEPLAPHRLDKDTKLELAATADLESILVGTFTEGDGDIRLRLGKKPLADHC